MAYDPAWFKFVDVEPVGWLGDATEEDVATARARLGPVLAALDPHVAGLLKAYHLWGYKQRELVEIIGVKRSAVRYQLQQAMAIASGERTTPLRRTYLKDDQKKEIISLWLSGEYASRRALADSLGQPKAIVLRVLRRAGLGATPLGPRIVCGSGEGER